MTALAITLGAGLVAEYEFEITHEPEPFMPEHAGHVWWASLPVRGSLAIGGGADVWSAIGACLADVPATHRLCDLAERVVDDLIASGAFGHEGGGE
jgi:hypothetical protein